jgi:hypothetical protein
MKKLQFLIIILSVHFSVSSSISKSGTTLSFQKAKLPAPMMLPQVVQTKTKYYVISQGNSGYFRKQFNMADNALGADTQVIVYEFMPANASLRKLSDGNFVRSFFGACVNGNKIYIAGGYDSKGIATSSLFEYDLTTKKWNERKAMSIPRGRFALECIAGKIYAIGGENTNGSIEAYKPEANEWGQINIKFIPANLKPMTKIEASGVIEDKICLINGTDFQIFIPATNSQVEGPNPPFKSEYFDVSVLSKKLYVAGGSADKSIDNGVYLYNAVDGAWSNVGKIPVPRYGAGLAYCNNMLIYLGGSIIDISKPAEPTNEIYIYIPSK